MSDAFPKASSCSVFHLCEPNLAKAQRNFSMEYVESNVFVERCAHIDSYMYHVISCELNIVNMQVHAQCIFYYCH
jgi:hypothetical protein